jgi:hypothetical protein
MSARPRQLLSIQTVAERRDESISTVWRKIKAGVYPQPIYPDGQTPRIIEDELNALDERAIKNRDAGKKLGRLNTRISKTTKATEARMARRAGAA